MLIIDGDLYNRNIRNIVFLWGKSIVMSIFDNATGVNLAGFYKASHFR